MAHLAHPGTTGLHIEDCQIFTFTKLLNPAATREKPEKKSNSYLEGS